VVDDDPFVLHVLAALLHEGGIECVQAVNGRDGLRRLSEELLSIDLLVTDLVMPELGGDALLLAVRELGGERDLPILVTSGRLDRARTDALRDAGADAVVDKSAGLQPVADAALALLSARGRLAGPDRDGASARGAPVARIAIRR
jgi:CheY-like chemotaxis protein